MKQGMSIVRKYGQSGSRGVKLNIVTEGSVIMQQVYSRSRV